MKTTFSNVYFRGMPEIGSNIHLFVPSAKRGVNKPRSSCNNGNYHIFWTEDIHQVTCGECKKNGRFPSKMQKV